MFRTTKCSSSGRLVHAVLCMVFLSCIHVSSPVDFRMCLIQTHILTSTRLLIRMHEKIPQICMYKSSWGWTLGWWKPVEGNIIKLNHSWQKCAFSWFVLCMYITEHGSKNIKRRIPLGRDSMHVRLLQLQIHIPGRLRCASCHTTLKGSMCRVAELAMKQGGRKCRRRTPRSSKYTETVGPRVPIECVSIF